MVLTVIYGKHLLFASLLLMISIDFPFKAGGSSKEISGKFYLLIVKKIQAEASKNYLLRSIKKSKAFKLLYDPEADLSLF